VLNLGITGVFAVKISNFLKTKISTLALFPDKHTIYFMDVLKPNLTNGAIEIDKHLLSKHMIITKATFFKNKSSIVEISIPRFTPPFSIFLIPYEDIAFKNPNLPKHLAAQGKENVKRVHNIFSPFFVPSNISTHLYQF